MDSAIYWIWLQQVLGFGADKIRDVIDIFGSAEVLFQSDNADRIQSKIFTSSQIQKIHNTDIKSAQNIFDQCVHLGYNIISYDDKRYPYRLKMIQNPPAVLYVCGNCPDFDCELTIAMVGTRNATHHGYQTAVIIAQRLGWAGAVIVSGCAQGIDTASHKGCLESGGKTVAVLGCGLDVKYNMQNEDLRYNIAENGAVISEYPPGIPPLRFNFPQRNRIISGLSHGVIVVEAGVKSGSLITAGLAAEQGRDIFAVPGNADSKYMLGVNRLIRDGAMPVVCALDVLSNYVIEFAEKLDLTDAEQPLFISVPRVKKEVCINYLYNDQPNTFKNQKEKINIPDGVSDLAGKLFQIMDTGTPEHIDELAAKAGLSVTEALCALTELEIGGFVIPSPGRRYCRIDF